VSQSRMPAPPRAPLSWPTRQAHWLPRLGLGAVMLFHGIQLLPDSAAAAETLNALAGGAVFSGFSLFLLGVVQVTAGVLVVLGGAWTDWGGALATRLGAAMSLMVVALFAATLPGWPAGWGLAVWLETVPPPGPVGGPDAQILAVAIALYLLIRGPRR